MNARTPSTLNLPLELRALWHALLEKWWLFAVPLAVALALALWHLQRSPRIYAATTTLQVEEEDQKRVKIVGDRRLDGMAGIEMLKTIEQNLFSPALMLRLATDPALRSDPAFLPDLPRNVSDARFQAALTAQVNVEIRKGTRLIDVTVEDRSPAMTQKLADRVVAEFVRSTAAARVQSTQESHEFLRAEADRVGAALAASEKTLQQYKEQNRAVALEEKQNTVGERLRELSAKVTAARAERLKIEADRAQIERLAGQPPEQLLALASVANAQDIVELRRRISEKEAEISALGLRYKAEHPKYIQAATALRELRTELGGSLRKAADFVTTAWQAARANELNLDDAFAAQEKISLELSNIGIPYAALLREVESDRALYDSLLARLKETGVSQGVSRYALQIIAPAALPERPIRPNKRLVFLLAFGAAMAVGSVGACGTHFFDTTLKTVDEAEAALGLRTLGAIPLRPKMRPGDVRRLMLDEPQSAVTEAFRALRTSLVFATLNARTVLFTSAIPGEGKSFCAINHAVSLAQQGLRTLLVDADLRLPSVGPILLGKDDAPGVTDVLRKKCGLGDAIILTEIENLSVLPSGLRVSNPAELIAGSSVATLIEQAAELFDRVVIDTAPVHAVAETLLLVPHAAAVILVARAARTPHAVVARALQRLRESGGRVAGLILNGLPARHGGYHYHYNAPGYGRDEVYGAKTAKA